MGEESILQGDIAEVSQDSLETFEDAPIISDGILENSKDDEEQS